MKLQNSNKLSIVYCLLIAVIVAVISFSLLSPIQNANADYEDLSSDYIANFNQYIQIVSATNPANTFTSNSIKVGENILSRVNITQFTLTNTHKYYMLSNVSAENMFYLGNAYTQYYGFYTRIITSGSDEVVNSIVISASATLNTDFYFSIIDLTQMFGAGNEPSLAQCKEIFTAQYYTYNTGTPMPLSSSYIDGYNNGVSDTLGAFTYKLNTAAVTNSLQSVDLPGYVGIVNRGTTGASISADGSDVNLPTGYLPFLSPIPAGAHFRIGGRLSHNQGNSNVFIGIGVYNNGAMQILSNNISASGNNGTLGGVIEFDAPVDISGIYIIAYDETASFQLTIYSLYVEVLNIDYSQLIAAAYQNGYGAGADNYAPGSVGYQSIYQEGYNAGLSNGNTIGSAWDFISGTFTSLGSIFSLEVMPNITLGVFIAIPLLLGLLLFILKVTRG